MAKALKKTKQSRLQIKNRLSKKACLLLFCFYIFVGSSALSQTLSNSIRIFSLDSNIVSSSGSSNLNDFFSDEMLKSFTHLKNENIEVYVSSEALCHKQNKEWYFILNPAFRLHSKENNENLENIKIEQISEVDFTNGNPCIAIASTGSMNNNGQIIFFRHIQVWELNEYKYIFGSFTDLSYQPIEKEQGTSHRVIKASPETISISKAKYSKKKKYPPFKSPDAFKYILQDDQLVNTL